MSPLQFPTQLTPLHLAAWFKSSGPVVQVLIEAGAKIEARDGLQRTPLHWAAAWDNTEGVDQLIKAKEQVNVLTCGNLSPLFMAARNNQRDSVVALCKAGAVPNLGRNPRSWSATYF